MSGALRQSQRANLRESPGNGHGGDLEHGDENNKDANPPYCVDLSPTTTEIRAEFKSHAILKVKEKLTIANAILGHKDAICSKLSALGHTDLSHSFTTLLPADFRGERKKNDALAVLLVLLGTELLRPILDNQLVLDSLEHRIRTPLQNLKSGLQNAQDIA